MTRNRGFSLTEVLVSLLLITSISLALLKQQWQVSQLMRHVLKRFETLTQFDNNQEVHVTESVIVSASLISSYEQSSKLLVKDAETMTETYVTHRKHQHGFGLIELCISLLLVSCIMSGLMQHYLQVKRQYQLTQTTIEEAVELQSVGEWIRMSVRKAGFTPCMAIPQLGTIDQRNGKTNLTALNVSEGVLQINRMSDDFVTLSSLPTQGDLHIPSHHLFQYDHPLLIADCYHAEVQQVAAIYQTTYGQWIKLNKPLAFRYQAPIYIGQWLEESFFISRNKGGVHSLAYKLHHTEELTPLVHSMTIDKQQHAGHTFVHIIFGLTDGRLHEVSAEARMS